MHVIWLILINTFIWRYFSFIKMEIECNKDLSFWFPWFISKNDVGGFAAITLITKIFAQFRWFSEQRSIGRFGIRWLWSRCSGNFWTWLFRTVALESLATDRIEKNEEACGAIEHDAQVIKDISDSAVFGVEADKGCNDVQRPLDA